MRILVTGASGSGTTTLARHFATRMEWHHIDADDYYWLPTTPPYRQERDPAERLEMILRALDEHTNSIVSGSVMDWGRKLEDSFDVIAFLYLEAQIRVERLRKREEQELGYADPEFLQWAYEYDSGPTTGGRSLKRHLQWLDQRGCAIVKIEGDLSVEARFNRLVATLPNRADQESMQIEKPAE